MKTLSVVIPVFNEEATINEVLFRVKHSNALGLKKEILVVNDASTDSTYKKLLGKPGIILINHSKNLGKAAAIKSGMQRASGDIILIQDADLEYSPENYPDLISPILHGQADVVYGSRLLTGKPHRVIFFWHYVANLCLTYLSNIFSNLNLSDMETGYKVFSKRIVLLILPHLKSTRFGIEPEITAYVGKLARKNFCRVYEVGISYYGRTYAEGKKIQVLDAIHAVWCIIKFNILPLKFNRPPGNIK